MELNIGTGPLPEKISVAIVLRVVALVAARLVACIDRTHAINRNQVPISFGSLPGPQHLATGVAFQKAIAVRSNVVAERGSPERSLLLKKERNVAISAVVDCGVPCSEKSSMSNVGDSKQIALRAVFGQERRVTRCRRQVGHPERDHVDERTSDENVSHIIQRGTAHCQCSA